MKVEIFDPAMCCSTGVCGPSVDPELTRVAAAIYSLGNKGFEIKRYNLTNEPGAFVENAAINQILNEKGPEALPVTLVNDEMVKVGSYPSNEEFSNWFNVQPEDLTEKPKARLSIDLNQL
ncbi:MULTISPECIES: arsenite efflux transporter metallochaperone ArsD [Peribacillus]|uniref:arsenite efflux transporter metallochaperone ArsD n=1 Tax=Peribacillus TaxID=2675229 RepID=UPI0007BFDA2F|nr:MULTISPECIES: arsenite efflux transporter metallochaperone ArsD [Peribacillus]MCM3170446.1 arsenite efflux transporter metallochaperone ArsD [Peribacillus frigoritolerans]MEE3953604.1 arsenite efflux transporter metallochaperone ArsD [Peribacillus frigoritolerans]MEE3955885.1 arsenite efflux transporter metallochaperone ArsD [Peribacillus frigoritolerans]PAL04106.1 arsenical resistance operon transcriptional repressor ArsD [Peribacillus simplex]